LQDLIILNVYFVSYTSYNKMQEGQLVWSHHA